MAVLFSDGFETGNFSNWTTTLNNGTGTVSEVIVGAKDTGTYGAHYKNTGGTNGAATSQINVTLSANSIYYLQLRMVINSNSTGGDQQYFGFYKDAPTFQMIPYLQNSAGIWQLACYAKDGTRPNVNLSSTPSLGTWYTYTMVIDESGTNPVYTLKMNGVSVAVLTDTTTGTKYNPQAVKVGAYESGWTAATDIYVDNVSITDTNPDAIIINSAWFYI